MLFEKAQESKKDLSQSLFFENPVRWLQADELDQIPSLFTAIERARSEGFWAAGYLGFECGYHWEPKVAPGFSPNSRLPLGAFGIYRAPAKPLLDGAEQMTCGLTDITLSLSFAQFKDRFERVQEWIRAGDTYQVNLTCQIETAYSQGAQELFAHMMQRQPVEFGAMLNINDRIILSASPELFIHKCGHEVTLRPMKGTSRRGRDFTEDESLAAALSRDEKNRAENAMIVDLLRSDVGRVAKIGSVHASDLFKVERHPSLLQMTSSVQGELREDVSLHDLFRAIFPSGSIVGAPKVRTMQIIRELEERDRGVYTGAIGYIEPEGNAMFSVAIRTAVLEDGRLSMGVGAGITSDSNAASEYNECLLKAEFLSDRSFDLIESMRWKEARCELLDLHMKRIVGSARFFGYPFDENATRSLLANHVNQLPAALAWKVRLLLSPNGACALSAAAILNESPASLFVRLWHQPMRSSDPWLQHKTTRRYLYDRALACAQKVSCVDALFVNEDGMVTEGSIHSILVRHGDVWRTPPLSAGILPGVYRRHLLRTRPEVLERDVRVEELQTADEIQVMNSIRGLRNVTLQQEPLFDEDSV